MKNLNESLKRSGLWLVVAIALTIAISSISVLGQNGNGTAAADTFSGRYEGIAKSADGQQLQLAFELKSEGGKVSGSATTGQTTAKISEGTLADAKLTLKFEGHPGVLTARVEGEKITGEWSDGSRKQTVELKKVVAATAAAAPAPAINLSGEWEGLADANGEPFPFLLVLKIDGEKVTGSSSSQLGESAITGGTWKDGRLNFQLEGQSGTIIMGATVVDGKLTGEFDFAGQMQGKWVAVKKK